MQYRSFASFCDLPHFPGHFGDTWKSGRHLNRFRRSLTPPLTPHGAISYNPLTLTTLHHRLLYNSSYREVCGFTLQKESLAP